jgi:tetratricopeptide (TPR) repeat protein
MSRSDDEIPDQEALIRRVGNHWSLNPPDSFSALYRQFAHPFLPPCEFFALDAIADGAGRSFGMMPQYLPFGRAVGDGGLYGFFVTVENQFSDWPVLFWDEDEMFLRPVASSFDAFLRYCVMVGRYETEVQGPDDDSWQSESSLHRLSRIGIPESVLYSPIPRNDTELYERLVSCDPQDATSLCHLGCVLRARGDSERSLDFYHRAIESAPWFGDAAYLVADIYRERGDRERAIQGWWAVVQRLLPLCTRTWEWDLGADHPEADIYEVAADGLAQYADYAEPGLKSQPLWRVVVHDDPYDPDVRESLGDALLAQNRPMEAEREYINALSLCSRESSRQPDRLYDSLINLYNRLGRRRDADLASFDRTLERPTG